uniref:C1q domain-containing protein n=1 Tax=Oncorhynchus tshawytscha TaxID=74940 RepID=A0AAZ3PLM3_ONCTS
DQPPGQLIILWAAAELVAEPKSPGTEVGPPNNRQPCTMWMGGVPGTSGHSGKQGRDDSPRGEKGDTGKDGAANGEHGDNSPLGPCGFPSNPDPVPASNVPIHFNKFFHNEQRHYDDVSRKVHCSLLGVYFFTYHLTVYTKDPRVSLFKNDKPNMFTYNQLESGDEVWLQIYGGVWRGGVYADNTNDSTFSWFLLHPDMGVSKPMGDHVHCITCSWTN